MRSLTSVLLAARYMKPTSAPREYAAGGRISQLQIWPVKNIAGAALRQMRRDIFLPAGHEIAGAGGGFIQVPDARQFAHRAAEIFPDLRDDFPALGGIQLRHGDAQVFIGDFGDRDQRPDGARHRCRPVSRRKRGVGVGAGRGRRAPATPRRDARKARRLIAARIPAPSHFPIPAARPPPSLPRARPRAALRNLLPSSPMLLPVSTPRQAGVPNSPVL